MKNIVTVFNIVLITIFITSISFASPSSSPLKLIEYLKSNEALYTGHTIWKHKGAASQINYQNGTRIAIGTRIISVKLEHRRDNTLYKYNLETKKLFTVKQGYYDEIPRDLIHLYFDNGDKVRIRLNRSHKTAYDVFGYVQRLLTNKTFEEITEGFDENVAKAIQSGFAIEGMDKKQVVLAIGYPPEHRTQNLWTDPVWTFWVSARKTKNICFDAGEKTFKCGVPAGLKPL